MKHAVPENCNECFIKLVYCGTMAFTIVLSTENSCCILCSKPKIVESSLQCMVCRTYNPLSIH